MAHLIDKDALVAEIKRLRDTAFELYGCSQFDSAYNNVLKSIDTLEVKEAELDVIQRMEECPYRQVGCTMYEGHILECKGACSWVIDYPKLKQLKAQKGEEV